MGPPILDSTREAPWATSSPRNYLHVKITSIQYFPTRKVLEEIIGGNLQFLLPSKTFLQHNFSRKSSHQFRKVHACKSLCHQGCIFRLTCSHPELTEDHVLTSAYVKIFRTATRNAVNKSVEGEKIVLDFP